MAMPEVSKSPLLSRRQSPRIHVEDELSITFADLVTPVRVRDVSFGGFALETADPVTVGETRVFDLRIPSGPTLFVRAKSMYCRKSPYRDAYFSGWVASSERAKQALMDAINTVTGLTWSRRVTRR
jgi:hypothetical protein